MAQDEVAKPSGGKARGIPLIVPKGDAGKRGVQFQIGGIARFIVQQARIAGGKGAQEVEDGDEEVDRAGFADCMRDYMKPPKLN